MNTVWDIIYLRRPVLNYVCPGICEVVFSGSSNPVIILSDPLIGRVTGLAIGGFGGFGLTWNAFPGALCYNVYFIGGNNLAVILAQCIEDPTFVLPPNGPGLIVITPVTPDGEGPPSDPIPYPVGGGGTSTVSVIASCPQTSRPSFPAEFLISRATGDTIGNLVVNFTLTGTAINGVDYAAIPLSATIPNGSDNVVVLVTMSGGVPGSTKSVILTITPSGTYTTGSPASALVGIRPAFFQITDYGNSQPLLVGSESMDDSDFCEWDGTFNFSDSEGVYEFADLESTTQYPKVSIDGKRTYFMVVQGPIGDDNLWQIYINCFDTITVDPPDGNSLAVLDGFKFGGATAAGTYDTSGGGHSDPRATLTIEQVP